MLQNRNDVVVLGAPLVLMLLLIFNLCILLFCASCDELDTSDSRSTYIEVSDISLPESSISDEELFAKLDAYEKHFDADRYFVFINTKYDVVGIYYGYKPLSYFKQTFPTNAHISTTLKDLPSYGIYLNSEINYYLNFLAEFPDDTPVIVCHVSL